MTDVKAVVTRKRGVSHAGKHHKFGAKITLKASQFADWEAARLVEREAEIAQLEANAKAPTKLKAAKKPA